jgi:hypothetical protein
LSTSWEQAVRTHPVDKLLEQHCYKSAAGLLQLVRLYVCTVGINRDFMHVTCFDVMPEIARVQAQGKNSGMPENPFWSKLYFVLEEIIFHLY